MIDYKSIADHCSTNAWTDYNVAFAAMSAETVTQEKDIATRDILSYLNLVDKRLAIEESVEIAAKKARLAFSDFDVFHITENAAYLIRITAIIDDLIAVGLLNADDKAVILSLGQHDVPVWPGLLPGHVQNALQMRQAGVI